MLWKQNNRFDTSLEALTPEGVKFILTPAGLPVRTLAFAIDVITQQLLLLGLFLAIRFLHFRFGFWLYLISSFCIEWFYHVICELAFRGRSLGKRITGIRVVKSDGSPVDPASSFIRNLLRLADTFLYFFPIAMLSMSISSGFRRLGDWAGNTVVVYTQAGSFPKNITTFLANYPAIVPPSSLSYDEKQIILNFARRYPLLGVSRANEIAGIYAPYLRQTVSPTTWIKWPEDSRTGYDDLQDRENLSDAAYLLGIARHLFKTNDMSKTNLSRTNHLSGVKT